MVCLELGHTDSHTVLWFVHIAVLVCGRNSCSFPRRVLTVVVMARNLWKAVCVWLSVWLLLWWCCYKVKKKEVKYVNARVDKSVAWAPRTSRFCVLVFKSYLPWRQVGSTTREISTGYVWWVPLLCEAHWCNYSTSSSFRTLHSTHQLRRKLFR